MALDGITNHGEVSETNMFTVESSTAQDEFKRFTAYCSDTLTCALYGKNVTELWTNLIHQANNDPIPAPGCVESGACRQNVTGEDILFGLQNALVTKLSQKHGFANSQAGTTTEKLYPKHSPGTQL